MKKFLFSGFRFFIVLSVCLVLFHFILLYPEKKFFKLPSNVTTVFLGNSTIECAVNDSLLTNTLNFARSSESLEFAYAKLKLLKDNNPQIDTAFLGFDDIILFNKGFIPDHTNIYFTKNFNLNDVKFNFKGNYFNRNIFLSHLYDLNKIRPILNSYFMDSINIKNLGIGGYLWLDRKKLEIIPENNNKKINSEDSLIEKTFPPLNKFYLDEIIEYCKENDITLIFLNTPKYHSVWKDSLYRQIHQTYYPEIKIIDLMEKIYPDSCYGDALHLNYKGARKFSKDFEAYR